MQQMKTPLIWKKLLIDGEKMVFTDDIHQLAHRLDKENRRSLSYLQEHGYIVRILRGIYYVRSPEERERNYFQWSIHEMVAEALMKKGVTDWYFGLETAMKLNGLTHEYYTVDYVITDSYWANKPIGILDTRYHFLKRSSNYFKFGIIKKKRIRYSDKEKTVLDIAYKVYRNGKGASFALAIITEYEIRLDMKKLMRYLKHYPKRFQKAIGGSL